jgi:zinc and cadmium transporter
MLLLFIVIFSLFGSVGAIAGASVLLIFPEKTRRTLLPCLLSYATGTLLGAAFLGMIPKAVQESAVLPASTAVLIGLVLFFLLEKLVLWRHCHDVQCEVHGKAGPLILIGDAFHNFVDGVVIAAAFLTSVPLGVAAAIAIIAHEVPQEVGDFAILLNSGYSRARAFLLNLLSSLATLPGAVIGYLFLATVGQAVPYILSISAASFIYIAIADLVPSLHRQIGLRASVSQLLLMLAGIGTIAFLRFVHS